MLDDEQAYLHIGMTRGFSIYYIEKTRIVKKLAQEVRNPLCLVMKK
jgi:hypothetical protein